jgi:diguanylate cyclase (GGDEF)-like protein
MPRAASRWWSQPDHYYWLTAFLAARDAQRVTRRAIAATMFSLAIVVFFSLGSPAGPQGSANRILAVAIAACALLLGLGWLRSTWPSRVQSAAFVGITSVGTTVACLIQHDAYKGMFGVTAFAVLSGYIAFFHTPRYLAINVVLAAVTGGLLTARLVADGDPYLAYTTLLYLAMVNITMPFACQLMIHLLGIDVLNSDIEPLTGLLNREAFYRVAAEFIGSRSRDDDRYFVIALISLDNFGLIADTEGRATGQWARVAVAQTLRERTRQNAVLAHVPESEFLIADSFPTTDPSPLIERVRGAIMTTPPRTTASIGVVSAPMRGLAQSPPIEVLDELIEVAEKAMLEARRAGGNQACHIVYPGIPDPEDTHPRDNS